jgi:hypothetical protein
MKRLLAIVGLCLTQLVSAQQTINFDNRVPAAGIDAPISYAAGTVFGGASGARIDGTVHTTAAAALYGGPDGSTANQLVLISPIVSFLGGASAGYINVGSSSARIVPGVAPGGFAMLQVRAWDAANGTIAPSYEAAQAISGALFGTSSLLRIQMGGLAQSVDLVGLQSFSIGNVPEPAPVALAALGLLCVGWFRMKTQKAPAPTQ